MTLNKEELKNKIIYRSSYRGSKEMDILLGSFVKKHINMFNDNELKDLEKLLILEDEVLYKWYFDKKNNISVSETKVSEMLKNFKL